MQCWASMHGLGAVKGTTGKQHADTAWEQSVAPLSAARSSHAAGHRCPGKRQHSGVRVSGAEGAEGGDSAPSAGPTHPGRGAPSAGATRTASTSSCATRAARRPTSTACSRPCWPCPQVPWPAIPTPRAFILDHSASRAWSGAGAAPRGAHSCLPCCSQSACKQTGWEGPRIASISGTPAPWEVYCCLCVNHCCIVWQSSRQGMSSDTCNPAAAAAAAGPQNPLAPLTRWAVLQASGSAAHASKARRLRGRSSRRIWTTAPQTRAGAGLRGTNSSVHSSCWVRSHARRMRLAPVKRYKLLGDLDDSPADTRWCRPARDESQRAQQLLCALSSIAEARLCKLWSWSPAACKLQQAVATLPRSC